MKISLPSTQHVLSIYDQVAYRVESLAYSSIFVAAIPIQAIKTTVNFTVSIFTLEYFSKYTQQISIPAAHKDFRVLALFVTLFAETLFKTVFHPLNFHATLNCSIREWSAGIIEWSLSRPYHDQAIGHLFPDFYVVFFAKR